MTSGTAPTRPLVHIVEDDDSTRVATARMLTAVGYAVETHATAAEFLGSGSRSSPGCVLLDVQLPDMSGTDLQKQFADWLDAPPIVFVTGHGDIPMSVRAIQAGAVDFLTKPVQKAALVTAVSRAIAVDADNREKRQRHVDAQARYAQLSPREREVFAHLIGGQLNKQVAYDLGTVERTIKAHRHNLMAKLGANSIVDLVHLARELNIPAANRG
jgi:FixJ family two-component response regulator